MLDTILTIIFVVALVVVFIYLSVEIAKNVEFEERIMRDVKRHGSLKDHMTREDCRAMRKSMELQDLQMEAYQKMQKAAKKYEEPPYEDDFW